MINLILQPIILTEKMLFKMSHMNRLCKADERVVLDLRSGDIKIEKLPIIEDPLTYIYEKTGE